MTKSAKQFWAANPIHQKIWEHHGVYRKADHMEIREEIRKIELLCWPMDTFMVYQHKNTIIGNDGVPYRPSLQWIRDDEDKMLQLGWEVQTLLYINTLMIFHLEF
jgi:hypothetical protein